jgi:hypothetical protein
MKKIGLYAVTIFLSAFLLFQVQPLIAKIILPWFGGSAAVWSASLVFFQLVLLAGYTYAHLSIRWLPARAQMSVHVALLLISCALLPILPSPAWRPDAAVDPTGRILLVLGATIGLPYFLLSATSPLLQAWYVRRSGSGTPYRLFALSNFGSLLALLSFPFLIEPWLASGVQAYAWSAAYIAFTLACGATAWVSRHAAPEAAPVAGPALTAGSARPGFAQLAYWVLLAACASVLLVSVTTQMSANVAPVPLMWIVPLALYLVTFILAFESDRLYQRRLFLPLLAVALGGMAYMLHAAEGNLPIRWAVPGFSAGLFICCMVCHGELARRRPAPRHLTLFYLMVALGGALGGSFVALLAPHIFTAYWELPLGLIVCGLLALPAVWSLPLPSRAAWPLRTAWGLGVVVLATYAARQELADRQEVVFQARNFYGSLAVRDEVPLADDMVRTLYHGTIDHGSQLLDPDLCFTATSYYGPHSGIGRALEALQARGPVRVGIIGLGAGVLASYGRKGDCFRIYEINPLVAQIARNMFTFYLHAGADKQILMGDARLTMERQEAQHYDLLIVDAFAGDAVPVHLLTREAAQLYGRHLKPDGILALHISNRYLDLEPVCLGDAQALGKQAVVVDDNGDEEPYLSSSTWVLVTSNAAWFESASFKDAHMRPAKMPGQFRPWTDDYSNLFQILMYD